MMKDITGQRFGRLVALRPVGHVKNGNVLWLCKCDCGNKCVVEGHSLRKGTTSSCGCLRHETAREHIKHNPQTKVHIGDWHVFEKTWHPRTEDLRSNNRSGITGVSFDKESQKWFARLYLNGKYVLSSAFSHKEDAIIARKNAEKKYLNDLQKKAVTNR